MNFDQQLPGNMPELGWDYGYIISLLLMAVTGGFSYWYFKRKGYL